MEKPNKEKYGWVENNTFDGEPSGWVIEGGEEAYNEALKLWETHINTGFVSGDNEIIIEK